MHDSFLFRNFNTIFGLMFGGALVMILLTFAVQGYLAVKGIQIINEECNNRSASECIGHAIGNIQKGIKEVK